MPNLNARGPKAFIRQEHPAWQNNASSGGEGANTSDGAYLLEKRSDSWASGKNFRMADCLEPKYVEHINSPVPKELALMWL